MSEHRPSSFSPGLLCGTAASENGQNASPPSPLGLLLPLGSTPPSYHRFDLGIGLCAFDPFRVFVCSLDLSGGPCATFCLDIFVSGANNAEAAHPQHHVASCYFLSSGLHLSSVQFAVRLSQKIYRTWFGTCSSLVRVMICSRTMRTRARLLQVPRRIISAIHSPRKRAASLRGNARLLLTLRPSRRGLGLDVLPAAGVSGRGARPCHGEREGASTNYEGIHEPAPRCLSSPPWAAA
ncbi:hypothetical protein BDN71DRAFT_1305094 [Pleurotus eryngii]|uniref:Uncharacterized protein n=1 Tax=Pleurotus eryngii TaxID=5323 RepID=A0A9P6DD79_PLEER|nr:hypothetical protein BDN71DRAFT_1305094 [Pleurotus eryngii]